MLSIICLILVIQKLPGLKKMHGANFVKFMKTEDIHGDTFDHSFSPKMADALEKNSECVPRF